MFSSFFIDRPIFATVISIVIVLVGVLAIPNLAVEKTPDITPPTVIVTAQYPGANAEVIAETVATPLEEQINGVENMLYMSSKSSDDGTMELTVTFEVGTDIDMATVLVQNRVSMAEPSLPEEVLRYGITTQKSSSNITLVVSLFSPDGRYDSTYLSNYINIYLKDALSRVEGVGNVTIFGAKDFSMRIWLNPELLEARNLTTEEVLSAIREQNVQVAAGKIGTPPSDTDQDFELTVRTLGRLDSPEAFGEIIVKHDGPGRVVRLKDVARIELGSELYSWFAQYNGKPSIVMGIFQRPGANALDVAENIRKVMAEMSQDFPAGLDYSVPFDPTKFIVESIKEVLITLGIAVSLVVLVVYVFLGTIRTTVIPSVAIPVSLIGTFAVMKLMGLSINTLSMFGLVLAIGIVVDDAIMVVENTMRIIEEEGLPPKKAAKKAMQQITGAVIATTLVLLAVFVPTTMIGGISGRLYSQFAITISTATVFSSINALTLSPALCGLFLKPRGERKVNWVLGWFDKLMGVSTRGYMRIVQAALRKWVFALVLFAGICAAAGWGLIHLPTSFLPTEDEGFMMLNVELPPGASVHRTEQVTNKINAILDNTPGVEEYVTIGGWSLLNGVVSSNAGAYFVSLKPWSERPGQELSVFSIQQQIQMQLFGIREAMVFAFTPPPIMGLGFSGGFEMQIQDRGGAGFGALQQVGDQLMYMGMEDPMVTRVNSSFKANVPQLYVDIDRTKVKSLDVRLDSVFNTMAASLGQFYANDFNLFSRTFKVMVQGDKDYRAESDDILDLQVKNAHGQMVPFGTFASVREIAGPQTVYHYNLYPSTTVTGQGTGFSSGQTMDHMTEMLGQVLPAEMGYEWSGISYQEIQAGNKAPLIFALASVFVFLFLAAQYESWSIPVAIILFVPFALFGAAIFSMVLFPENNIYTQIGLVLLIGLSSKTAILLVEFAKSHHDEGHGAFESALTAARLRFRPILMTALSFVFGVLPLMMATGAGAMARRSLGTAVFGGMLMATIFGVFFIPIFYYLVQQAVDLVTNRKPGDSESGETETAKL